MNKNKYIINGTTVVNSTTLREELQRLSDKEYKAFTEKLNPGVQHILGVRIPALRKLAKQIARGDWKAYLDSAEDFYMEERMLHGLVLGYIKPDMGVEEYLQRVSAFVRIINCWAVCDSFAFASGKVFAKQHEAVLWPYLKEWMRSDAEYEVRFGVVMAMKYFIDEDHLDELFRCLDAIHHEKYYVKMAVAWAISVCFVCYPKQTMCFLHRNTLDDFTYNKALQKVVESDRVSPDRKEEIKKMRR